MLTCCVAATACTTVGVGTVIQAANKHVTHHLLLSQKQAGSHTHTKGSMPALLSKQQQDCWPKGVGAAGASTDRIKWDGAIAAPG